MAAEAIIGDTLPQIEGYRVLRKLGEGGMGSVYLGEDQTLGRRVAIKRISTRLASDSAARARFLREARAMATVEHPNLVRVYSFGESEQQVHLVMEYVEGETLADRVRRQGRLSVDEALPVVEQIVSALEAAAEKGIVHRDIKPANILIDTRERVRVADFGLAKPVDSSSEEATLTQAGLVLGTPHYLSPEQARGESADLRSDIYSLRILLYELLAGVPPFRGATPAAVLAGHLHTPLPELRDSLPELPERVARLVSWMTQKSPARRPESYAALRRAIDESTRPLERWAAGSPYRGLAVFDLEHAPVFFGRGRAIDDITEALQTQQAAGCAFVVVLGMSGSGKSSLLRAGVLPRLLRERSVPGADFWRWAILRPADSSGDLFDGLAAALLRPGALPELKADGTTAGELARLLRDAPRAAAAIVKGGLSQVAAERRHEAALAAQPDGRLALVIDQMEELFTFESIEPRQRQAFVSALAALAGSGRAAVLGALRSDYFPRCEELPELMALKEGAGQYHLLPPTPSEMTQMIRQPARAAGLRFEEEETQGALDEVLREAASGQQGSLPLLEFALEELYQRRTPEGQLTFSAYRSMGGLEGALSRRAEAVFSELSTDTRATLPEVLSALVRVESNREVSRRYAALEGFDSPESRALIEAFIGARLFVADRTDQGVAVVSIAHDALLRSWRRLDEWLESNRELLRIRERITAATTLWAESGKPRDLLLAEGKPLEEAWPLLQIRGLDLSRDEQELIRTSEARARGRRRARWLMNANGVALLVAAAFVLAFWLWRVLPPLARTYTLRDELLPLSTRVMIIVSNGFVRWILPLLLVALPGLFLLRKRIRVPELVRSGMALAIASGLALLVLVLVLLAAMTDVARVLGTRM